MFSGIEFTYEDYISIENKYVASIKEFCDYFNIEAFEVKNVEFRDPDSWDDYSLGLKGTYERLRNKKAVSMAELDALVRLILREYVWCVLENKEKGIHFGYDYYMYFEVGTDIPEDLKIKIEEMGLYID